MWGGAVGSHANKVIPYPFLLLCSAPRTAWVTELANRSLCAFPAFSFLSMPSRLLAALFIASAHATEDCLTTFAGKVGLHTDVGPYAPLKACNKVKAGEAALNGDDPETVCNSAYKIAGNTFKICKCARPRPSRNFLPAQPRKPSPAQKRGGAARIGGAGRIAGARSRSNPGYYCGPDDGRCEK